MKTLFKILLVLFVITNIGSTQTRLRFGSTILKDTLSGSMFLKSGSLFVQDSIILNRGVLKFNVSPVVEDIYLKTQSGNFLTLTNTELTSAMPFYAPSLYSTGNAYVQDNLTVDSILTTRNSAQQTIDQDDGIIIINSSFVWIRSDNPTAADRTFALPNGTTSGQVVKILFFLSGSDKCELLNAGNVLTKDGATRTFDVDREMIVLTWDGTTYWVEDGRSL